MKSLLRRSIYNPKWQTYLKWCWMLTIKQGDYADQQRCSKDFKPFGISLQQYFKTAAK